MKQPLENLKARHSESRALDEIAIPEISKRGLEGAYRYALSMLGKPRKLAAADEPFELTPPS